MHVYTDGSCSKAMGGWAWWCEELDISESGVEFPSTNQRMEIYAALDAVDTFLDDEDLAIFSDSAYLVNCFKDEWWRKWRALDWVTGRGGPVKNRDIWEPLVNLVEEHGSVRFVWVKGHNGNAGNEIADRLATSVVALAMGDG